MCTLKYYSWLIYSDSYQLLFCQVYSKKFYFCKVQSSDGEAHYYDFHIVYSNSYRVPVLYFRGYCIGMSISSYNYWFMHKVAVNIIFIQYQLLKYLRPIILLFVDFQRKVTCTSCPIRYKKINRIILFFWFDQHRKKIMSCI